jgi:hypothetical protein
VVFVGHAAEAAAEADMWRVPVAADSVARVAAGRCWLAGSCLAGGRGHGLGLLRPGLAAGGGCVRRPAASAASLLTSGGNVWGPPALLDLGLGGADVRSGECCARATGAKVRR